MDRMMLKSNIIPPLIRRHFIYRKGIFNKLTNYQQYPITLVHAGPGYGKSITVSMFLEQTDKPFAWFGISEELDVVQFMKLFIYAIREKNPDFGEICLKSLEDSGYQGSEEENLSIWFSFIHALNQLPDSFILVLDDIHIIHNHNELKRLLEILLRHLPRHIHLILVSRIIPLLKDMQTMLLKHQILEINQEDLALNKDEIADLFANSYNYPLEQKEIEQIHEKTEGWVIAVQLIWQGLVRHLTLEEIWNNKSITMEGLFQYLAIEIMGRLPANIQTFVKKTSLLSTLQVEDCQYLMPEEDAAEILKYLRKQNLFIQMMGNRDYRYHTLFRDFIQSTLTKEEKRNIHHQLYEHYQQLGNIDEALRHVRQLAEQRKLAAFLNSYGLDMVKQGKLEVIQDIVAELDEQLKNEYPLLWILIADIDRLRCKYEDSINKYQRGGQLAFALQDYQNYIHSLAGEARVYLDTVQPSNAEPLLKKALRLSHKNESYENMAYLYALYSENQLNLGNTKVAEKLYILGLNKQHEESLGNIEARFHLRTGRISSALQLLEEKQKLEYNSHIHFNARSHRETSVLMSIMLAFSGEGVKAKEMAEQGIQMGEYLKSPFVEAVGWMRLGHALQLLSQADTQSIIKSYEKSLKIMDDLGVEKGKVESLMGLCLFYGLLGELDIAIHYGEDGVRIAEQVNDTWFANMIRLTLGIAYTHNERYIIAKEHFLEAYQGLSRLGDQFSTTVIWMWLAYIAHQELEWENFEIYTKHFLYQMNQGNYHFLIQQPSFFGPRDLHKFTPYLIEVKRRKLDNQGIVSNWLLEKGWLSLEFHPGYTLRIQTLGNFRVWLGERELKDKEWQREKAKLLFQLLITRRHELLSKKWIQDTLWPDNPEEQSNRDFKVALNALNKALEPNRPTKASTFFIQRHGNSYGFNLVSGYELDVELFEQNILQGLQEENSQAAFVYLQKGLQVYNGDFLPEQVNEDWILSERDRLKLLFLRGAERLAKLELEQKNTTNAMEWGQRIISEDPTWEEAYKIMMLANIEEGNRTLAINIFHKCKNTLKEEIGVDPMPETIEIYKSII